MPVQLQGVTVHTLPGACEGRPDGLHAFLEPAATALEDPEPYVGPGLSEKREMNAEPVVFPRRGSTFAEEFLQPLLAVSRYTFSDRRPARDRAVPVGPTGTPGSASSCSSAIRPAARSSCRHGYND